MATVSDTTHSIEVDVPVRVAYNQWTQFEEFPHFMEGVRSVQQKEDDRVHFVVDIAGRTVEYDAEITEQIPDQRIAWRSRGGKPNGGVVTFHRIDDQTCRVALQLEYAKEGVLENVGDLLGLVDRRAKNDLKRFKQFIESRGRESGAWRGEIRK